MRLQKEITDILKKSFKLVFNAPLLWLFFYIFILLDLFITNFLPSGVSKLFILIINLVVIGLPGLKVEFLDSLDRKKQPQYNQTPKLLFYYFKKLFIVNLFLIFLGSLFFVLSSVVISLLPLLDPSIVRMAIFLPLATVYFSLFHLFVVVLVKTKKGVLESLKISIDFLKKNLKISLAIILVSLIIHYPVSELMMILVDQLPFEVNYLLVRAGLAFFNVLIDLFFFAVWMVLYKKKS